MKQYSKGQLDLNTLHEVFEKLFKGKEESPKHYTKGNISIWQYKLPGGNSVLTGDGGHRSILEEIKKQCQLSEMP